MNTQTSYTQEEILRLARKPRLRTGNKENPATYRLIVDSESVSVNEFDGDEKGCYQLSLRVAPLKNPDDGGSRDFNYSQFLRVTLPLTNPDIPGHKVPADAAEKAIRVLAALRPDIVPAMPVFADGRLTFKGETIQKVEEEAKRVEAVKAVLEVSDAFVQKYIKKAATEAPSFEDYACYADAILTKKGNVFMVNHRNALRPGQEKNLVPAENFRDNG